MQKQGRKRHLLSSTFAMAVWLCLGLMLPLLVSLYSSDTILPELDRFAPGLLIVSAGFDAHKADPLAQLRLDTADYAWITKELLRVAAAHCDGRVVSVLEGGYDLEALAASAAAHVRTLMVA